MGIMELFSAFVKWTIGIIPTLVGANRELRELIRDSVGQVADELSRGMELVALRLQGAKSITDERELAEYLRESREKLLDYHSEFKVCKALRDVNDRFKRAFDPLSASIGIGKVEEVEGLLYELEKDERMILPRRSIADALGQCFIALAKGYSPRVILEGDIQSCFDQISHEWMLDNIPMDRKTLEKWLKAGYVEGKRLYATEEGTPQGGIISPVLANLVLDGLETVALQADPHRRGNLRPKINVVRYADDFIITGSSREQLIEKVRPAIEAFLAERGLRLSEEKTKITSIEDGFDFLGATVRKYGDKLLIRPSKRNILDFLRELRRLIRTQRAATALDLIRQLNSKLRGWANQQKYLVSSRAFRYVDRRVFQTLWQWAKRRHPTKGKGWVRAKYYRTGPNNESIFSAPRKNPDGSWGTLGLYRTSSMPIRRHVKVQAEATAYDPAYDDYFRQ
jgi:RNA-directed DNA polymerase